jgi:hypothetical protein
MGFQIDGAPLVGAESHSPSCMQVAKLWYKKVREGYDKTWIMIMWILIWLGVAKVAQNNLLKSLWRVYLNYTYIDWPLTYLPSTLLT